MWSDHLFFFLDWALLILAARVLLIPLSFRASYVLGFLIELLAFLPGMRHLQRNLSLSPPNPLSLQGRGLG